MGVTQEREEGMRFRVTEGRERWLARSWGRKVHFSTKHHLLSPSDPSPTF